MTLTGLRISTGRGWGEASLFAQEACNIEKLAGIGPGNEARAWLLASAYYII